jgi:hypothetical protein
MELFGNYDTWTLATRLYFGVAVFSTLVMLVQLGLTMFGMGDADVDVDLDVDVDAGDVLSGIAGITYFSISSITAFLCIFGWVGFISVRGGGWGFVAFIVASVCGLLAFFAVAYLLNFFRKMAHSGNIKLDTAIGGIGNVYLQIPEGRNETGAVIVSVGGSRKEYRAISENAKEIETGERVKVTALLDSRTLIVVPVNTPSEWMEKGL